MSGRQYHVGELLTLSSGETWKVDRVYDHDGRPGVGLVNPANPNHGTAFYADVLDQLVIEAPAPREVRESPDGVLAIYDPRRTGRPGRGWLVIDVPGDHHAHHRGQPLTQGDVQDWAVLTRQPRTEKP
jgi:hypothetical protein